MALRVEANSPCNTAKYKRLHLCLLVLMARSKACFRRDIANIGAEIMLGNTFHLWLRPGTDIVKQHGGLHQVYQLG
jgi:tRNA-guanine family transglycosylase